MTRLWVTSVTIQQLSMDVSISIMCLLRRMRLLAHLTAKYAFGGRETRLTSYRIFPLFVIFQVEKVKV